MKIQKQSQMSFAGNYVERCTRKNVFFHQVDQIIDFDIIEKEIEKVYKKGLSVDGRPSYRGIVLFKMMLLQAWYNLSDPAVEDMVNDSLGVMHFCQLELEDEVPDHSTLSRFRKELVEKKAFDRLLRKINKQLKDKRLIIKEGSAKVDASITHSPFSLKGKTEYEIAKDREEDDRDEQQKEKEEDSQKIIKKTKPGVDSEGHWLKKAGKRANSFFEVL